ncbi:ABC transporter substrate-binding protein [Rhodobacteraceae bacterium]|nr:ABC transporter substrate-binding protein [Paracoccaceae bacterium]
MKPIIGMLALAPTIVLCASVASAQEIKIWTLVQEGMPEFMEGTISTFEAANPGVTVVNESFPNEAYKTQIQVALTGSAPPDVFFNWAGEDAARLVRDGLAADISAYGASGYAKTVGEGWLSSFAFDGANYGVPTDAVSKYFYYDPAFFSDNDLSVPETFDEFLATCQAIRTIDSSIVPWPLGNSERWKLNHVITMLNQRVLGLDALAADYALTAPDDELFTNPGYVEAWQKVVDMQDAGCFQDAPNATSPEASRSMFAAQVSPMIYCGTWCGNIFQAEGYEDFEMFRFPALTDGAGDPGGQFLVPQGYMVSSKSEHPELAAAFISHIVSDEGARDFAEQIGGIVSNPALIDEVDGTRWFKFFVSDIATATESVNVIDVLLDASVANAYLDAGVEILNGTMTPEDAMTTIREAALAAKSG